MDALPFPHHLDDPPRVLFWTIDELIPLFVLFAVGILTGRLLVCITLGFAFAYVFGRYRDSRPDGYLLHLAYWYGVFSPKGRSAINPFMRRIYPA